MFSVELIEMIQRYVDGANIYVPQKEENRLDWGQASGTKNDISKKDADIYQEYLRGSSVNDVHST